MAASQSSPSIRVIPSADWRNGTVVKAIMRPIEIVIAPQTYGLENGCILKNGVSALRDWRRFAICVSAIVI